MQLNLNMMQIMLRQIPVLIMVLTVIVQLVAVLQQRNKLVLEQPDHGRHLARNSRRLDQG